jgi:hypothetical protein
MMKQEQIVDPSNLGGLQKKLPVAMKEKEAASVLAVKAMQEKTSVSVAQGTEETGADAVEKRRWRRRKGTAPNMQELKMQAEVKKKRSDIEAMWKAEVASVGSVRKENATFHSTIKWKDVAVRSCSKRSQSQSSRMATHMLCKLRM